MSTIKSSDEHLTLNADGSSKDIKLQSNASEKVIVKSSGNVGIGITSPLDILHLNDPDDDCVINLDTAQANKNSIVKFSDPDAQGRGMIQYNHTTDSLRTTVAGTERTRIHSDGVLSVPAGVALGVAASSNASSNTLDDYEEGTHTVTVTMGTGSAVLHTSHRTFQYTKVGRVVHVSGQVLIDSASNADGEFQMSLPFTVGNGASFYSVGNYRTYNVDTPNDGVQAVVFANSNEAKCNFAWSRDQATSTNERATVNGYYMIGLTYMT